MDMRTQVVTVVTLQLIAGLATAATRSWDGGGDGHSWNSATNWNPNGHPGFTDTLNITTTGTIDNVYRDAGTTVYSDGNTWRGIVNLNQGTILLQAYFGSGSNGRFTIGDGTNGTNDATVNVANQWEFDRHANGTYTIEVKPDGLLSTVGTGIFKSYPGHGGRKWTVKVQGGRVTSDNAWNMSDGPGYDANRVNLSTGGTVRVGPITVHEEIVDFEDGSAGSFSADFGGSFADIAAVRSAVGSTFTSSGGAILEATDNGDGSFTVGTSALGWTNPGVSNVTTTSALAYATLSVVGGSNAAARVYWKAGADAGETHTGWDGTNELGTVSTGLVENVLLSNLVADTTYTCRFYGTNSTVEDDGWAVGSFTTIGQPGVDNAGGADPHVGYATLAGNLTNGSRAEVVVFWGGSDGGTNKVAWGHTNALGELSDGPFSTDTADGLLYGLTYYYRCYVTNAVGDDWADATASFTTRIPVSAIELPDWGNLRCWLDADDTATLNTMDDGSGSPPADGQRVGRWEDKSGNGYHATEPSSARPTYVKNVLNHRPVLRLAVGEKLDAWSAGNADGSTVFVMFRMAVNQNLWTEPLDDGSFHMVSDGNMRCLTKSGGQVALTSTRPATSWAIQEMQVKVGAYRLWLDGAVAVENADPDLGFGVYDCIGQDFGGDIAEAIVYDDVLSDADHHVVGGYLAWKYGIASSYDRYSPPVTLYITNSPAANVSTDAADLNGWLSATGAVFDVYAFWGPDDRTTNAALWASNAFVGAYTNFVGGVTQAAGGLTPNTICHFRFMASNRLWTTWATNMLPFLTAPLSGQPVWAADGVVSNVTASGAAAGITLLSTNAQAYLFWGTNNVGDTLAWAHTNHFWETDHATGRVDGVAIGNLAADAEYFGVFYATNSGSGQFDWSDVQSFVSAIDTAPAASVVTARITTVELQWPTTYRTEDAFYVWYSGGGSQATQWLAGADAQGGSVKGLLPNTPYAFRVAASNAAGLGPWSAAGNAMTAPPPAGEIAIYTEAGGGEAITTTVFDHDFDTEVRTAPDTYDRNGSEIGFQCDGHYLVLYSARFHSSGGANRSQVQTHLRLAGTDLPIGYSQCYHRRIGSSYADVCSGGGVIVAGSEDALVLRSYRTDNNGGAGVQRTPNGTGIQVVKLPESLDYCRLSQSADLSGLAESATFEDVTYDTRDELDAESFAHVAGTADITLKTAGHYLVFANTYFFMGGDQRAMYRQRLVLDQGGDVAEAEGTRTTVYVRSENAQGCGDGAASLGTIIETAVDNAVLNVEVARESTKGAGPIVKGGKTAITIVKLPDNGEYVRLSYSGTPAQNMAPTDPTAFAWDQERELDGVFSRTTTDIAVNEEDDYLFLCALYCDADGTHRGVYSQAWSVNGAVVPARGWTAGYMRSYDDQWGTSRTVGNWSGSILELSADDAVQVIVEDIQGTATANVTAGRNGVQGVRLASIMGEQRRGMLIMVR